MTLRFKLKTGGFKTATIDYTKKCTSARTSYEINSLPTPQRITIYKQADKQTLIQYIGLHNMSGKYKKLGNMNTKNIYKIFKAIYKYSTTSIIC